MAFVLKDGVWVDEEEELQRQAMTPVPVDVGTGSPREQWIRRRQAEADQGYAEMEAQAKEGGDQRPFWAPDAGAALSDAGKIAANAVTALGTDYVDLGLGLVDVVHQSGRALAGQGFDAKEIFDDSDNPLTQWRRETFRTESQAGQAVSNMVRIGTALITLPKFAAKGLTMPLKAVAGVNSFGEVSSAAKGIATFIDKLDDFAKAGKGSAAVTGAMEVVEKGFQAKTAAARAAGRVGRNDWLQLTYADVAKAATQAPELTGMKNWMDTVRQSTRALTQLSKGTKAAKIRSVGEALAWDTFVAFNVYGEGDYEFDETLGDMAVRTGNPLMQRLGSLTATNPEDAALTRKLKQMVEGIPTGIVMNAAIDMARVYRFAKNYKAASPAEQKLILDAFSVESQNIGDNIGRVVVANGKAQARVEPPLFTPQLYEQFNADRRSLIKSDFQAQRAASAEAPVVDVQAAVEQEPLYKQWQAERMAAPTPAAAPAATPTPAPAAAPTPAPAAAGQMEIPAAAGRKLSPSQVQSKAEMLMQWANSGRSEKEWLIRSIDDAVRLVQAKGLSLDVEKIPGINLDAALNARAMGQSSADTEAIAAAYRQFYGVPNPGGAPAATAAVPQAAQPQAAQPQAVPAPAPAAATGPGTLGEYEAWLAEKAGKDANAADALRRFKAMQASAAKSVGKGGAIVPAGQVPRAPTEGVPGDMASPVQQRLAQMEGVAEPLNDDPLYQEWLASRTPQEQFMPPAPGANPAMDQFQAQAGAPLPKLGGPDDLGAYRAWLEGKARMPEAELDPRVQQSLRRLDGVGELAPMPRAVDGGLAPSQAIEPVTVRELRQPEATVTPQTIRAGFEEAAYRAFSAGREVAMEEGPDGVMREVGRQVRALMPRNRVDALQYLRDNRPVANRVGVVHAADSEWMNFIHERGLMEGWATIDPDTMQVVFNRSAAANLDRGEVAMKQAQALDDAAEIAQFNAIDVPESFRASQLEQPLDVDPEQMAKAADAEIAAEVDPARRLAEAEAIDAARAADALDNAEEARLLEADAAKLKGETTDDEVVQRMLGTTLDSAEAPVVVRAETGRGWEVYDRDGEPLGSFRTKGAAEKAADDQLAKDRKAMVARARQMDADQTGESINIIKGTPIYDSDIVSKIKLTDAQINAVQGIMPALTNMLDEAWLAKRGESAFYNINELGPQKRTFELTQGDMLALSDALKETFKQAGDLKGSPRMRALRNLADKLETEMKLLEPQARAQRFVDNLLRDTAEFLDHGEFCNFF